MSTPDPSVVRKAAAQFQPKRPPRFEMLLPWKDVIEELRSKRASCHTIADFLSGYGIQASKSTIANFCKEVLNEPGKRKPRTRRRKLAARTQEQGVITKPANDSPKGSQPNGKTVQLQNAAEPPSDQPRKRGPRIANIELIDD